MPPELMTTGVATEAGPTFRIFTGALQPNSDNPNRVHCTASSSMDDLHGDVMEEACVADMASQAKAKSMLIFLNHEYKVPRDVFGQTADAVAGKRDGFMDLDLDVDAATTNQFAVDTLNLITVDKMTLGVSIGCMVEEWDYKDQTKGFDGGLRIKKVKLLEASIVGIPANQRSWTRGNRNWVRQAAMAVKSFESVKADGSALLVGDESRELAIAALSLDNEPEVVLESTTDAVIDEKAADPNEPDALDESPVLTEAGGCPTCGKGQDASGCDDSYHKEAAPELVLSHNDLPDSAFACIESGGKKDESGKTTPRSLRHYPHHTASGSLDDALLRNALSRIGDKSNIQCGKSHLLAHARDAGIGEKTLAGWEIKVGDDVLVVQDYTAKTTHEPETYETDVAFTGCTCLDADATPEVGEDAPESGMSTSEVELTVSEENVLVLTLSEAVSEVVRLRSENAALRAAVQDSDRKLAEAAVTVEKLARMPLGRRTSALPMISDFRRAFKGVYPDAWLDYIEEKDKES